MLAQGQEGKKKGENMRNENWTRYKSVVEGLISSYETGECQHISYQGSHRLPDWKNVAAITNGFFPLCYPGYRGPRVNSRHFSSFVRRQVSWIQDQLSVQINRALRFGPQAADIGDGETRHGEELAGALLASIPEIRKVLEQDIQAAFRDDPAAKDYHIIALAYPGPKAVTVYRLAHELDQLRVPLIPRMMTEYAHSKWAIDIHPAAKIGPGFFIDHGTAVVIGETAEIGSNVRIYQGVTLGARNFPRDSAGYAIRGEKRHPTLQDNVIVYANSAVFGGDTVVGRNSDIGANVAVTKSLEPERVIWREKQHLQERPKKAPLTSGEISAHLRKEAETREPASRSSGAQDSVWLEIVKWYDDGNPNCQGDDGLDLPPKQV
jgi:serine O-acetyltransferase